MSITNQRNRARKKPLVDKIVLIFEIEVTPTGTYVDDDGILRTTGELSADGPYDRTSITLSWDANKVPDSPTTHDVSIRQALKQFLRADGWDDNEIVESGYASHAVTSLRVKGKKFYPADRTLEAKRAMERQGKVAA